MLVAIDTHAILPGKVGGIENYTLALIESLQQPVAPAQVVLLTRPENHELFSPLGESILLERPARSWGEMTEEERGGLARKKKAILAQRGVDVVHFTGNTINPLDLDLPVVLNLHDLQHRHFPQYFSAEEIANREKWWVGSAHRADALIAASNYIRDDLIRQLGVPREKIFVAHDPFLSAFGKSVEKEGPRERFFVYPAAVWPHKNHERLIRAFVKAGLGDFQLVLTGGGQEESGLGRLVGELGAEGKVRLAGRVSTEELISLYSRAAGMIFPSQHESWSIPVMEAMACGCAVACSNVTSLPEETGEAGILFGADDEEGMISAMRRLAGDEGLRRRLGELGRKRVEGFGLKPLAETLGRVYRYAIERRAVGSEWQ